MCIFPLALVLPGTCSSWHVLSFPKARKLLRVSPNFMVLALGLPVPRFPGHALDPPLRSRFQADRAALTQLMPR